MGMIRKKLSRTLAWLAWLAWLARPGVRISGDTTMITDPAALRSVGIWID
jgi:hypothetical protein